MPKMTLMVGNILLINLDVNLSAVLSVLPSYWLASVAGQLKKSLVFLTTAKILVSSYIPFIESPKH